MLTIRVFDLESHLADPYTIPRFLLFQNDENIISPEFTRLQQCKSALASWLLLLTCSQVNKALIRCITIYSTTRNMSLYDRLNIRKLAHQSMQAYIAEIQLPCDRLSSCGIKLKRYNTLEVF